MSIKIVKDGPKYSKEAIKNKKNEKSKIKYVFLFLLFEIVFTAIIFPLYIFYGPFKEVRDLLVEISMSTGNYQFVAKTFLSDEEINNILNKENQKANSKVKLLSSIDYSNNYEDIIIKSITNNKFEGKAIIVNDPKRVKVGYSDKLGEVGETVSEMAERYGAIAAINGGGYEDVNGGYSGGTGGVPLGILISHGEVLYPKYENDYYKKSRAVFSINKNGEMYVGQASVSQLIEMGSQEAISFEPTLVVNGQPYISQTTVQGINPRTAIGQTADGRIILLVIDGRQGLKWGARIEELQQVMISLGAVNAMALDGGGSSAMYYDGEIINNPSNLTGERSVPDIVYVEK